MISGINDEFILAARLLLATLFLIFGWRKLRDFSGTINQMVQLGVPSSGTGCRRCALHGASDCVRGRCWSIHTPIGRADGFVRARHCIYRASLLDGERCGFVDSLDGFYKDLSIVGGFLLLCVAGAGKFSIDAVLGMAAP